jgi:hypothetical protein
MRLAGERITVILTEDGRQILKLGAWKLPDSHTITVLVVESEDLGLWVKLQRADQEHFFLIRWEYILAAHLPSAPGRLAGLRIIEQGK